jgi:cytochrome oxidase Cu insertion factor (SCO1/SenC/PrrC family)
MAGSVVRPCAGAGCPQSLARLKRYVALFHSRMIELTGDRRQIREVTSAYKVYFAKMTPAMRTDPSVDHSSVVYILSHETSGTNSP